MQVACLGSCFSHCCSSCGILYQWRGALPISPLPEGAVRAEPRVFKATEVLPCSDFGKGGREEGFFPRFAADWGFFCHSAMAQLCRGKCWAWDTRHCRGLGSASAAPALEKGDEQRSKHFPTTQNMQAPVPRGSSGSCNTSASPNHRKNSVSKP